MACCCLRIIKKEFDMDQMNRDSLTGSRETINTHQTGSTLDNVKTTVADKLKTAADALHEKVAQGNQNEKISNYGQQAERFLNRSSDYIRDLDLERVNTDIKEGVRRNPGRSLLIAGAVGLLLGVLVRR
jgi:ElaB/YqjD/DUF883 family membrane-anchored ribosome-binding protein